MTESQEKSYTGKFFDFEIFDLKYVLKHSDLITSDQKIRPKIFDFDIFSLFYLFLLKNDRVPGKKFCTEKNFRFQVFVIFGQNFFHHQWFSLFRTNFSDFRLSIPSLSQVSSFFFDFFGIFFFENHVFANFLSKKFFSEKFFSSFF